MPKNIKRIVLTGGPAAGKTTLISRILKEFKQEDGWRVITIPETATELISGFGIKPFGNCLSMYDFQYYVIGDQLHKEALALKAAQEVPEQNILIIYDRALLDDKAYISDDEFKTVLSSFDGRTEEQVLKGYDAVLHLVTCAKGAEFAYDLGNAARTESVEAARASDDRILQVWSVHPNHLIIDNSINFEDKINRAVTAIYSIVGYHQPTTEQKRKYLISMPDLDRITQCYGAQPIEMMQTYLIITAPGIERRVRQQRNGSDYLYFYTEKHITEDGAKWDTEKPISEKMYVRYLMECDPMLHSVRKTKYLFSYNNSRFALDIYPFSKDRAILFSYADHDIIDMPPEISVIREVTGDSAFKNRQLARMQNL